jgi:hypothetical protein
MIMAMIVGQGGAVRKFIIVIMVLRMVVDVFVAACVIMIARLSVIMTVRVTVAMIMIVPMFVVMMLVTSGAMVMAAVVVPVASPSALCYRSARDEIHDCTHGDQGQKRDAAQEHRQVKLLGKNQIECIFLPEQDAHQPQQTADDQCANLFEAVVAVTVVVCVCH